MNVLKNIIMAKSQLTHTTFSLILDLTVNGQNELLQPMKDELLNCNKYKSLHFVIFFDI